MADKQLKEPNKKSVILELSNLKNARELLSDEEQLEYFQAIIDYELYDTTPSEFKHRISEVMFKQTAKELDYQMEKWKATGLKNKKNKAVGDFKKRISLDDAERLKKDYKAHLTLVDEVAKYVYDNNIEVEDPYKYIVGYAKKRKWNEHIEKQLDKLIPK